MTSGWSSLRILDEDPQLAPDDLQAVFAFIRNCQKDDNVVLAGEAAEGTTG